MSTAPNIRPWQLTVAIALVCGGVAAVGGAGQDGSETARNAAPGLAAERIVAASVSSTEILLGLVARDRIAAVHYLAADPIFSTVSADIGGIQTIGASPEQILAMRPDLVITDEYTSAETQRLLETVGVPILRVAAPRDFQGVGRNIDRVAAWVGCSAQAERQLERMQLRIGELGRQGGDCAGWRIMNLNGDFDTYGSDSLFDAAVRLAGARNIPAENGAGAYLKLDIETVIAWRPDALVISSDPAWIESDPILSMLPCVQQKRYIEIPSALLSCQSENAIDLAARIQDQLLTWGQP